MNKKDLSKVVKLYSGDIPFVERSKNKKSFSLIETFLRKRVLKVKRVAILSQFCIKVYKIIQILLIFYMKFYLKNKI